MYKHVGASGWLQTSFLKCPPCFWRQGLSLARNLPSKLDWLIGEPHGTPGNPLVFISPVPDFQVHATVLDFLYGV